MKKLMMLGLLMVLGFSFAQPEFPTSGLEWNALRQTTCQGFSAWIQTLGVYGEIPFGDPTTYYLWDGGCYIPRMPYSEEDICEEVCDEGGVWDYYIQWAITCSEGEFGPTSPECQARRMEFYSAAKSSRGMFSVTRSAQLLFARQALYTTYRLGECGTSTEDVREVIMLSNMAYRECLGADSEEFFGFLEGFCSDMCEEPE